MRKYSARRLVGARHQSLSHRASPAARSPEPPDHSVDTLFKLAGVRRWRPVLASPQGKVHASRACTSARRPGRRQRSRPPAWRARLPGRGLYLHRQESARDLLSIMAAAMQGRSSDPIQPAAGVSALSTETICGPKLRPPGCPPPGVCGGRRTDLLGAEPD